jgi:hypothetical protein
MRTNRHKSTVCTAVLCKALPGKLFGTVLFRTLYCQVEQCQTIDGRIEMQVFHSNKWQMRHLFILDVAWHSVRAAFSA